MGRRKKTDEISSKPIRGPGRKSKKQGAPTFPKELQLTGKKSIQKNVWIIPFFLDPDEKKRMSSRGKKRFEVTFIYFPKLYSKLFSARKRLEKEKVKHPVKKNTGLFDIHS
jgi:hypothetical protein